MYYTLYTIKLKICTQLFTILLPNFPNLFKVSLLFFSSWPLVVSSFLSHTHTDRKDNLLEWPDRSCLLLYVSARIH